VRDPKTYEENTSTLSEYERIKESFTARDEQKDSRPLWQKLITSAPAKAIANVARLTSASELATELPVIGKPIENALNTYPGIRTAAAVLTNPLTYATGGISGGVTAGIGAGLGEAAFSQEGLDLPMPFVPGQYKGMAGAVLGGLAGAKAASIRAGSSAASASAAAEADLTGMESGALKQGSVLHTADGQTFTPRRPTFDTGEPLDWNTVSVKDPNFFEFNAADKSYRLSQDTQATLDEFAQRNAVNAQADVTTLPLHQKMAGNPVFDVVGEGVKAKAPEALQSLTPGYRTITSGAKAIGGITKPLINPGNIINARNAKVLVGAGAIGEGVSALGLGGESHAPTGQEPTGFWNKLIYKAGEALSPAVDPWVNAANTVFDALPQPVREKVSSGAHKYQDIVDTFITPVTNRISEAGVAFTSRTLDPIVNAILPESIAKPVTDAIDFAGGLAPYLAIELLTAGTATPEVAAAVGAGMTATFGAQGVAQASQSWEAYKQGDVNTGQFLTSLGMSAAMVKGLSELGKFSENVAARRMAKAGDPEAFRTKLNETIDAELTNPDLSPNQHADITTLKTNMNAAFDDVERSAKEPRSAEEFNRLSDLSQQLAPVGEISSTREKTANAAIDDMLKTLAEAKSITDPDERIRFFRNSGLAKSMGELAIDRGQMQPGEQPPVTQPVVAEAANAAVKTIPDQQFHEEVVSSSKENGGGTFDVDTNRTLRPKAFGGEDTGVAVAVHPDRSLVIPEEAFTPEVVARFRSENTDVLGNGSMIGTWVKDGEVHFDITQLHDAETATRLGAENAQKAVFDFTSGEDIPVDGVSQEVVDAKIEAARQRGQEFLANQGAPNAAAESAPAAGGSEWIQDTFDRTPRRLIDSTQYGKIYERQDGTFDFFDSRWADVKTGQTSGATGIHNYPDFETARQHLEDLTAHGAAGGFAPENPASGAPHEGLNRRFQEDAAHILKEEGPKFAERQARPDEFPSGPQGIQTPIGELPPVPEPAQPDVVTQANEVVRRHEQPRVINEAEDVVQHAQENPPTEGAPNATAEQQRIGKGTPAESFLTRINEKYPAKSRGGTNDLMIGRTEVKLVPSDLPRHEDAVLLDWISTPGATNKGFGSKALDAILDIADETKTPIVLQPEAQGTGRAFDAPLDDAALYDWYTRHGFEGDYRDETIMRYEPGSRQTREEARAAEQGTTVKGAVPEGAGVETILKEEAAQPKAAQPKSWWKAVEEEAKIPITELLQTRADAATLRERSMERPVAGGGTVREAVLAESKITLDALDAAPRIPGTDAAITSLTPEHTIVLDKVRDVPAIKEWIDVSTRVLGRIKTIFSRGGFAPEDTNMVNYGGIVLSRKIFIDQNGVPQLLTSRASFNIDAEGRATVVNDPFASMDKSIKEYKAGNIDPVDHARLVKIFGEGYTVEDYMSYGMAMTTMHEMVHRTIMGHKGDFRLVFDDLKRLSADELPSIVQEYRGMIDHWQKSGDFETLRKAAEDVRRIDQRQPTNQLLAEWQRQRGNLEAANVQRTDTGTNRPAGGAESPSGVLRPTQEGRGGLEGNAGNRVEDVGDTGITGTNAASGATGEPSGVRPRVTRYGANGEPVNAAATSRPVEPTDNKAYDIVDKFRIATDNVKVTEGGPGLAFLKNKKVLKDKIVQPLRDIHEVMSSEFADNLLHHLGQKAGEAGGWKKFFVETIGGKAATAKHEWEKALVSYRILRVEGEQRKHLVLNWLRQDKPPFKQVIGEEGVANGKVIIENKAGKEVLVHLDDVFSNPSKYNLTTGQKTYIDTAHKIIDDLVEEMRANGVDIKELGIEKRGEHYFPRFVKGKDGFELDRGYSKAGVGAKGNFLRERVHRSMAEGEANGVIYAHPLEALEGFVDQANKTIAGKKLIDALAPYGITGKQLALEDVGYITIKGKNGKPDRQIFKPLYAAVAEARKARAELKQLRRDLGAATRGTNVERTGEKVSRRTIQTERKLSMRELTSMANEDEAIQTLQKSLADARAKQKYGNFEAEMTPAERKTVRAYENASRQYKSILKRNPQDAITFSETGKPIVTEIKGAGEVGKTIGGAKTPTVKQVDLEAAYNRMIDTRKAASDVYKAHNRENIDILRDTLTEKLAQKRAEIKAAHEVGRGMQSDIRTAKIDEVKSKVADAQARFDAAQNEARRVARDMSAIVRRKSNAMTAETGLINESLKDTLGLAGDTVQVRRASGNAPGLNGKLFPKVIADAIDEGLNESGFSGLNTIAKINDWARLARTSTDFGYLFIQGLPVLMRHPIAFSKAMAEAITGFVNPEAHARWLATKSHVTNDMYPHAGGFSGNEYFTAARGSKIKQLADTQWDIRNPSSLPKRAAGQAIQRFAISMDAFLDAAKINMWEGMQKAGHLKTLEEKVAYGKLLRNMTGTTDTARLGIGPGQRQLEGLISFSPRFTRSVFALAAQAMESGPGRVQAIQALGSLMGGAALMYTMTKLAVDGEMPTAKDFDPTQGGRFMSVKVGNNWYGLGGSMRGAIQLAGYLVASVKNPDRLLSTDSTSNDKSNPFLKYIRGRLSPLASSVVDLATGKTLLGEDTTDRKKWLAKLPDQFMPFAAQTLLETEGGLNEKWASFGAQGAGFRTFPESANEDLNARVVELAKDKSIGGWNDLTTTQKVEMLTGHPELQKMLDKSEVNNWTQYKQVALDSAKAKAELGARWLKTQAEGGVKKTAEDLTSKEYRDQISTINQRLAGARAALSGADPITGLGGNEFKNGANTPRQKLMQAYYQYVDKNKYIAADGTINWDMKDKLDSEFQSTLSDAEKKVVQEETAGTSLDPIEKKLKEANNALKPYFDLYDSVAQRLNYPNQLAVQNAPKTVQSRYDTLLNKAQELWRRSHPDEDRLLKIWGRTSKLVNEPSPSNQKSGLTVPKFESGLTKIKVVRYGS
jgi:hypothetical protein